MQFSLFDTQANEILGVTSYEDFSQALAGSGCTRCSLCKGRTQIVVDRGNPRAKIAVIGEGPGREEDEKGLAFVGQAGRLMDKIFEAIGLDTNEEMLILNIIKCRPPDNRTPHKDEVRACLPFLQKQIHLVKPRVVLLLGATSLSHMDPSRRNFRMEEEAGRFLRLPAYPGIDFMVLYHPAALLYNARLKPTMWEHVKTLKRFIEKEEILPARAVLRQLGS